MRFQDMQLPGLVAVGDQVLAEVLQGSDLANGKLGRPPDHEPPGDLPGERDFHSGASRLNWRYLIHYSIDFSRTTEVLVHRVEEPHVR
jgi:hypothetical protein